jgi:predicted RNA-binding Zn ribbon-like protein
MLSTPAAGVGHSRRVRTGYSRTTVMEAWDQPAPGELALVQRFVNTADLDTDTDQFADAAGLAAWLREAGLADDDLDEFDRRRIVEFREALRRLLLFHNGAELDASAVGALDAAGRTARVQVAFDAGGAARLEPAGRGVDRVLGRLLAIVARAQAEGTWPRLKACSSDTCMWAYYDRSRNRSRTWCTMSICGNRAKARSYRARQR